MSLFSRSGANGFLFKTFKCIELLNYTFFFQIWFSMTIFLNYMFTFSYMTICFRERISSDMDIQILHPVGYVFIFQVWC